MVKAVIFDLDGTLLNTLDDLAASVNFALRSFGFPERTTEEVRRFIGNGVIKLMQRATPDTIDEATFNACFEAFRTYYLEHMTDHTAPYDGIMQLLDELKKKNIKTAVVSNKLHSGVVGLCKDFFKDSLTCAFGVENESERKPSPANVYKAFKKLGISANEAIYVGDSEVDVATAKNSDLDCIGVTWGFRDRKELVESGAKFIVNKPLEILDIVTK
ncbi:MAG: HAD family hydrolase [Acutalibacteraceae bacterium]